MSTRVRRSMPIGAEVRPSGVHFRIWAPKPNRIRVVIDGVPDPVELAPEEGGYFSVEVPGIGAGAMYRYFVDDDPRGYPDPASRFQPEGPHGPSMVIDPDRFGWNDHAWPGIHAHGQVHYELHVGTFTPSGTWAGAGERLADLAELGVTVIELMPVADFPGRYGWGYDGVNWFAPSRLYGVPDDLRRFVDLAHGQGLAVILDVVYNHFGPDGNYVRAYSESYFATDHSTDWGEAINFGGPDAGPVREFVTANAAHWIREYHLDGLRLDATQDIHDTSDEHIVVAVARAARTAAGRRRVIIVAENEPQDARLVRPQSEGGYGLDGVWNDDFHHSAAVAMTGHSEAYYRDCRGSPQELISAVKWGYLFQGQFYLWQGQHRGRPTFGIPACAFVQFVQNHDQIANSARGLRIHELTSPGRYRALTALLLLAPGTPLLFQGQEYAASSPFLYFCDHSPGLGPLVRRGRVEFLSQFPSIASATSVVPDPCSADSFYRSRLDYTERFRGRHAQTWALHRDLLRIRREVAAFRAQRSDRVHGAVLGPEAFVLRFFGEISTDDRLLLVNLGRDLVLRDAAEPLLAPPERSRWQLLWSSEDPAYGGSGTPQFAQPQTNGSVAGHSAVVLQPASADPQRKTGE